MPTESVSHGHLRSVERKFSAMVVLVAAVLGLGGGSGALAADAAVSPTPRPAMLVEDSRTRVGPVKVRLSVRDLELIDGRIEGTYRLRIPLMPNLNDRGRIRLDLTAPLSEMIRNGEELSGEGLSSEDGRTHDIVAALEPDGRIQITIDTGKRVLRFKSDYRLNALR